MQNSNCAVIITEKPGYTFKILSFWYKKPDDFLNILFTDQCNFQQLGHINKHDCVYLLVSSLINMPKKEDMVNNFHVRVKKKENRGKDVYWRT